jgi:hypothetical protein
MPLVTFFPANSLLDRQAQLDDRDRPVQPEQFSLMRQTLKHASLTEDRSVSPTGLDMYFIDVFILKSQ